MEMGRLDQKNVVDTQYASTGNLDDRISLHDKYSLRRGEWFPWLFAQYDIRPGDRILELGCGTGTLWASRYDTLPAGVRLVLSDSSEVMVTSVKRKLGHEGEIEYRVIDVQDIGAPDHSFDLVIANMMLYHVPDLSKGLSEIRRVLKPDGTFYCATSGDNNIGTYLQIALKLPPSQPVKFTLQNGTDILQAFFGKVEKRLYTDALAVTDLRDLVAYARSLPWEETLQSISDREMTDALEACRKDGVISIPKEYGTFIATAD